MSASKTVCILLIQWLSVVSSGWAIGDTKPAMPMAIDPNHAIQRRWLQKTVHASRLLDDMEDLTSWSHRGAGALRLTDRRHRDGRQSLRLTAPTKGDQPGTTKGRPFGAASAWRVVAHENWQDYNRLSFWVYPTLPGFRVISLSLVLHNDGAEKVPGPYSRNGLNFVLLKPNQWNHVVWEIAHLGRDRVTGVEFTYRQQGHEPGATASVTYDFDRLELQRVDADHFEGWNVAPGRIAYCHTGYEPDSEKTALASDLKAPRFQVLDAQTRQVVLDRVIETRTTSLGRFQVLDFTEIDRPGTYLLRAGDTVTPPLRIARDVWADTIWKTINLFTCERCGTAVPGIHDTCHRDWLCRHEDRRILINGGWHDAGDLSQGLTNTAETVTSMLALSERLASTHPELSRALSEEARWGLDWVLKTRFGDGYRCTWATMDFWTDGILGTVDDVCFDAGDSPVENLRAAAAEARGAVHLRAQDPIRAAYCLQAAREDWQAAAGRLENPGLEPAAEGLCAALDLYRATDDPEYADRAVALARTVLACQQQRRPDWDVPLTGFFYTDPKQDRIRHYAHRSHEQAPIVALSRLCRLFPDHPDWMDWYAAVALYSEYLLAVSEVTAPYHMLPASIYTLDESDRDTFQAQVRNGIRLDERVYLRRFPVWESFRGNHGTVLSQTKALATAGRLRRDRRLIERCRRQVEWVLGRNPFCQSTMTGEGHDFAPQYTALSGDMVGSLPVGIQTHFDRDVPYWPAENCYNWKEVWVHPSSRWLWLMCDLFDHEVAPADTFKLSQQPGPEGTIRITAEWTGPAKPPLSLRAWNLKTLTVSNKNDRVTWTTEIQSPEKPWIAVVSHSDDPAMRQDIGGGNSVILVQ
jgi:hypothetical protein